MTLAATSHKIDRHFVPRVRPVQEIAFAGAQSEAAVYGHSDAPIV